MQGSAPVSGSAEVGAVQGQGHAASGSSPVPAFDGAPTTAPPTEQVLAPSPVPSRTHTGIDRTDVAARSNSWAPRWLTPVAMMVLAALAAGAITLAYEAQQRAKALEVEGARRQQESAQAATEARVLARQAEAASREAVARMALLEARVAENTMQRSQIEDLLQALARSRDENVLADLEAAVRVAQQQSAITGSAEPMLLVLRQAEERLARYNQPRLERVRRAVAQDLERTRAAGITDLSLLTIRLDEMVRQVDELPLLVVPQHPAAGRRAPGRHAESTAPLVAAPSASPAAPLVSTAPAASAAASGPRGAAPNATDWVDTLRQAWTRLSSHVWSETRALVRVTRIDDPEAMLIAPEQAYFLRENLKLRLLNARLALLSRQFDIAQSDLRDSLSAIERYFDRSARRTTQVADGLRQVIAQARMATVPRPDATLAAIATASAGR